MTLSLTDLAARMRDIDTCLLCTESSSGLDARPMSNNRDVEFSGTSWFFTDTEASMVQEVEKDPNVLVTYTGTDHLWVAVSGTAVVHTERALMEEHWDPELQRWFAQGVDTPGLRLLEVKATKVRYWSYADGDGEFDLTNS